MELVSEKKQLIGFITLEGALGITVLTCGTACNVWTLQAVSVLPPPCIEAAEAWEFNVFLQPASW